VHTRTHTSPARQQHRMHKHRLVRKGKHHTTTTTVGQEFLCPPAQKYENKQPGHQQRLYSPPTQTTRQTPRNKSRAAGAAQTERNMGCNTSKTHFTTNKPTHRHSTCTDCAFLCSHPNILCSRDCIRQINHKHTRHHDNLHSSTPCAQPVPYAQPPRHPV
jgi:hypothetical protein